MANAKTLLALLVLLFLVAGCLKGGKSVSDKQPTLVPLIANISGGKEAGPAQLGENLFGMHATQNANALGFEAGVQSQRRFVRWNDSQTVYYHENGSGVYNPQGLLQGIEKIVADSPGTEVVISFEPYHSKYGNLNAQKSVEGVHNFYGYPSNPDAWKAYLAWIVELLDCDGNADIPQCAGAGMQKVKYWQIGNEWLWQWKDSPENYIKLLKESREAILQADPDAKIVASAITAPEPLAAYEGYLTVEDLNIDPQSGQNFDATSQNLKRAKEEIEKIDSLFKDGSPYFDVLDLHFYSVEPKNIEAAMKWLKDKKQKFASNAKFEIWSLEHAGPFKLKVTDEELSSQVVQRYAIGSHAGLSRIYWSSLLPTLGWPQPYLNTALVPSFGVNKAAQEHILGEPKPAYYAYKQTAQAFKGKTKITKLATVAPQDFAFELSGANGEKIWIAWTNNPQGSQLELETGASAGTKAKITSTITTGKTAKENFVQNANGKVAVTLSKVPVFVTLN